jgi:DNA-binding beta-propeller fold protein YncE
MRPVPTVAVLVVGMAIGTAEARTQAATDDVRAAVTPAAPPVANVNEPFAVAVAGDGEVLVADRAGNRIVRIDPRTARLTLVARIREPLALALDRDDNVSVVSEERIRKVSAATGRVTTIAGTGARGWGGDDRPAKGGPLDAPIGLAFDRRGNLFVAEYENRVRRIDASTGLISAVAGNGVEGFAGDGGPARSARVSHPHGVTVLRDGTVVVADSWNNRIRRIDASTGEIRTIARLNAPIDVAAGPDGSLYVATGGRIRRIAPSGTISTVAPRVSLGLPNHVAIARDGRTLYVSDFEGRRVLRIDARAGSVSTLAR